MDKRQNDITVIYYTSNQEKEGFESKIKRTLLENKGDLPLISVSQKPIDFGFNICVGDIGISGQNVFRQMQIGAIEAKTQYICTAEADCLYPPEYFQFKPMRDDTAYIAVPLWVAFFQREKEKCFALKPRGSELAMIIGRETLINGIETMLEGLGKFGITDSNGSPPYFLRLVNKSYFELPVPVVTIKTDNQLHRRTPHNSKSRCKEIPYWGNIYNLMEKYL